MDPGYLKALYRSNVELVTDPINTLTEKGILGKSGKEYAFDVLILATGFDLSEQGLGLNVVGRDGKTLTEQWIEQNGPQAYLGTAISNFPSFYTILGPNVASGSASVVYSTEAQVGYISQMIKAQRDYGVSSFEVKNDAEKMYNEKIQGRLQQTVWSGCQSYYKLGDKVIATFPGTTSELYWRLREPKWEDYHQVGGRVRVAQRKGLVKLGKLFAFIAAILAVRKWGIQKIKTEGLLFLLVSRRATASGLRWMCIDSMCHLQMRYSDVMRLVQRLRPQLPAAVKARIAGSA